MKNEDLLKLTVLEAQRSCEIGICVEFYARTVEKEGGAEFYTKKGKCLPYSV